MITPGENDNEANEQWMREQENERVKIQMNDTLTIGIDSKPSNNTDNC